MSSIEHQKIYKTDSKGKTRVWWVEQSASSYRVWDGTLDGKQKCSVWREAIPTNEGRANYRDGVAQATFEIEALYKKKLEKDYHETLQAEPMTTKIFQPMLAGKYSEFSPGYAQPKLDGIRCIAKADGLWSRSGKKIVSCPHIEQALLPYFRENQDLVLDGELYNHEFRDDFNSIQSLVTNKKSDAESLEQARNLIQYHIYDIPSSNSLGFSDRLLGLFEIFMDRSLPFCLKLVDTIKVLTEEEYDEAHAHFIADSYEGSMWRSPTGFYENKRSKHLLKRKDFVDDEFEILEYVEGEGNWSGTVKSVKCRNRDGKEFYSGIKGSRDFTDTLYSRMNSPHKFCTIRYQNLTPDGIPRFPVAVAFWEEKREH